MCMGFKGKRLKPMQIASDVVVFVVVVVVAAAVLVVGGWLGICID